jgi:hypothetical protein
LVHGQRQINLLFGLFDESTSCEWIHLFYDEENGHFIDFWIDDFAFSGKGGKWENARSALQGG